MFLNFGIVSKTWTNYRQKSCLFLYKVAEYIRDNQGLLLIYQFKYHYGHCNIRNVIVINIIDMLKIFISNTIGNTCYVVPRFSLICEDTFWF